MFGLLQLVAQILEPTLVGGARGGVQELPSITGLGDVQPSGRTAPLVGSRNTPANEVKYMQLAARMARASARSRAACARSSGRPRASKAPAYSVCARARYGRAPMRVPAPIFLAFFAATQRPMAGYTAPIHPALGSHLHTRALSTSGDGKARQQHQGRRAAPPPSCNAGCSMKCDQRDDRVEIAERVRRNSPTRCPSVRVHV